MLLELAAGHIFAAATAVAAVVADDLANIEVAPRSAVSVADSAILVAGALGGASGKATNTGLAAFASNVANVGGFGESDVFVSSHVAALPL